LFELAAQLGIGFYLGYGELTPDGHHYNTAILVDEQARIVARYRKIHLPGHSDHKPDAPFQHLEKKYFEVGNDGLVSLTCWARASASACAMTAAGPRPIAS
jgi:predicted amidohydrolase